MHSAFLVSAGVMVGVTCPDSCPRPSRVPPDDRQMRLLSAPAESIFMGWQPSYPSLHHPKKLPRAVMGGTAFPAAINPATAPVSWRGTYPDLIHRRVLPVALRPFLFDPMRGSDLVVAARLAWLARPGERFPAKPRDLYPSVFYVTPPDVINGAILCVELAGVDSAVTDILDDTFTAPAMLSPALTMSTIVSEDLC